MSSRLILILSLFTPSNILPVMGTNTLRDALGSPNPKVPTFNPDPSQSDKAVLFLKELQQELYTRNTEYINAMVEFCNCSREHTINIKRTVKGARNTANLNPCHADLVAAINHIAEKHPALTAAEGTGYLTIPE